MASRLSNQRKVRKDRKLLKETKEAYTIVFLRKLSLITFDNQYYSVTGKSKYDLHPFYPLMSPWQWYQ